MRRNALTRITTVLYAVWLVVALGVQAARPCPTHDAASLAGTHATVVGTAMPGMPTPGMPTPGTAQSPAHGSSHGAMHHACTCVGCCCATTIDPGSARTVCVPPSRIVVAAPGVPGAARAVPASRAARLLPFANAPPGTSSIAA